MIKTSVGVLGFFFTLMVAVAADFSACPQFFVAGKAPVILNEVSLKPRELCFSEFAILYSGARKTPVYVAQRLNKKRIPSTPLKRTDHFFADARLRRAERAELTDYKRSKYDRGHLAPAGDMTTGKGMAQSFSLANMAPQIPAMNRKAWAGVERATRRYIRRAAGDVYVITGTVYEGKTSIIGNGVAVPRYFYKLVFDAKSKRAWAHWMKNAKSARPDKPISYNELARRTGIRFLLPVS